jgi:hydrogenase expression/formation protein HypE
MSQSDRPHVPSSVDNPSLNVGDDSGVITKTDRAWRSRRFTRYLIIFCGDIDVWFGTVNDVSMMGAMPLYLTAGFISKKAWNVTPEQVVASMHTAAREAGWRLSPEYKVVQKGKADGLYVSTLGLG